MENHRKPLDCGSPSNAAMCIVNPLGEEIFSSTCFQLTRQWKKELKIGKTVKRASLVIIGDEILSGRTEDKNLAYLASSLGKIGISLSEARVVLDDEEAIISSVNSLRKK